MDIEMTISLNSNFIVFMIKSVHLSDEPEKIVSLQPTMSNWNLGTVCSDTSGTDYTATRGTDTALSPEKLLLILKIFSVKLEELYFYS